MPATPVTMTMAAAAAGRGDEDDMWCRSDGVSRRDRSEVEWCNPGTAAKNTATGNRLTLRAGGTTCTHNIDEYNPVWVSMTVRSSCNALGRFVVNCSFIIVVMTRRVF